MVRKIVLSLIAVLGMCLSTFAQNRQVSGTVTGPDGAPIAGATIMVDGTHVGTTTGTDGKFAISAPANASLAVSFIGYESQQVAIAGRTKVDIKMAEDTQRIDDVVVTGYGVTRKAAFTGAASVVSNEIVNSKVDANFMKSLQGAVTGLTMNNASGNPGAYAQVFVRGVGSINSGSQPLYVVDGMPVFSDEVSMDKDLSASNSNTAVSPMANINPNDIESVTVLKDATATAIYGARAANGVIVITTKKGSEGNFNLNLDIKQGVTQMASYTDKIKMIDSYRLVDMWAHGRVNAYGEDYNTAYNKAKTESGWDGVTNENWVDAVKRNGYVQDYNLSVSGSTGKTSYFASMGYMNNEGIMLGTDMKRYSGRLNVATTQKIFRFGMNTSYTYTDFDTFAQGLGGSMSNPFVTANASAKPVNPIRNQDGSYYIPTGFYNPVAIYDEEYGDINNQKITAANFNPYLAVDFGKGIVAKTSVGVNIYGLKEYNFWSQMQPQGVKYNGLGQQYDTTITTITWTNTLSWNYTFNDKHNIGLMIGQEMQDKRKFYEYYAASNYAFLGYREMVTASEPQGPGVNETQRAKLASYFFNAEYDYDNRYYISGSFRRDGSSVFGSENLWGNFWSVGAKWRLSEEAFLKDNEVLTAATIRASYGAVGNQDIGWYSARGFYETGFNYANSPGIIPGSINNPSLGWERSEKLNVGVDFSLLRRLTFTIDAYREKTSEMIFDMPLSMTTGNATTKKNIGSMKNVGIEIGLNATILAKKDLMWTLYANASHNKNEIIALSTSDPIVGTITTKEAGRPLHQFYMPEWAGVNPANGKPMWYKGSEGTETTSNYNEAGKRYVGCSDPKWFGGFGTSFAFKGLDVSANFTYTLGNKVYVDNNTFDLQNGHRGLANVSQYVYDNAWTPQNTNASVPQFVYSDTSGANKDSSRFLYDGSFLRMKNLTIGYTFPKKWMQKASIQKLRVYFSADNLWTAKSKDFIGIDPETYADGIQMWQYPLARTFSFGVSLGF